MFVSVLAAGKAVGHKDLAEVVCFFLLKSSILVDSRKSSGLEVVLIADLDTMTKIMFALYLNVMILNAAQWALDNTRQQESSLSHATMLVVA